MIQLLDKHGQPLKLNIKATVLAVLIGLGAFTGGASFPDLNPLSLISQDCSE